MAPQDDSEPLVQPISAEPAASREAAAPVAPEPADSGRGRRSSSRAKKPRSANMLPQRERRTWPERMLVRLIATFGVVAVGVVIGAIMTSSNSQGWIIGLVVSAVSVILAALLWSSRVL